MNTNTTRAIGFVFAIALGTLLVAGCGSKNKGTNPAPPAHSSHFHDVSIANFAYSPAILKISAHDTVLWTNNQGVTHTVTSDTGSDLAGSLGSGATYQHIFSATGSFPYHCTIHPSMQGTVTVQ